MLRVPRVRLAILVVAALIALMPATVYARGGGHGGGGHFGGGAHFGGGFRGGGPFRGGFGPGFGYGFGYYPYYYGYDGPGCVWVRRVVPTPYGLRWRLVQVCY
jgi:hypothetical protein